ncbi:MAG TPA: alpha/beta hydrolase [Streptosporangiaceae bacterium]|nr:alpha/beta hydrolase [Streptosporangiaceae bacterium]
MPLDPQVQAMRDRLAAEGARPLYTMSVEEAREADLKAIRNGAGGTEPVGHVSDREIYGPEGRLPVRVYSPETRGPWPLLVYYFGGGWCLGTLDTSDDVCRRLTNAAGCVTVSVGYRLAPEHKFPAAVEDCYAGLAWAAAHAAGFGADPDRLAVAGDSSGGNLAAAVTLLARDRGGPTIAHQVLVCPITDYRADTPSMREVTDPLFFNPNSVAWYWDMYLASSGDGENELASPLRATDLTGLPPATVITAEYDPLCDEGERYAQRLREAGVPTQLTRYEGMVHGFFTMTGTLVAARRAVKQAAASLHHELG